MKVIQKCQAKTTYKKPTYFAYKVLPFFTRGDKLYNVLCHGSITMPRSSLVPMLAQFFRQSDVKSTQLWISESFKQEVKRLI